MVSTHASTSQVDGSDSDSSVFSFSVITPTVGYSDNSEWILDTGATYHEKLNGCFAIMGDDHPCNMEGIGTVHIKMFDRMVRELKEVGYVSQLKGNLSQLVL